MPSIFRPKSEMASKILSRNMQFIFFRLAMVWGRDHAIFSLVAEDRNKASQQYQPSSSSVSGATIQKDLLKS